MTAVEKEKVTKGKEMDKVTAQLASTKEKLRNLQQEKSELISSKVTMDRDLKASKKQIELMTKEVCLSLWILLVLLLFFPSNKLHSTVHSVVHPYSLYYL